MTTNYKFIDEVTAIMREADVEFETTGGGTRHYVRDLLLPKMEAKGLLICKSPSTPPLTEEREKVKCVCSQEPGDREGCQYPNCQDRGELPQPLAGETDDSEMWHPQDYSGRNKPPTDRREVLEDEKRVCYYCGIPYDHRYDECTCGCASMPVSISELIKERGSLQSQLSEAQHDRDEYKERNVNAEKNISTLTEKLLIADGIFKDILTLADKVGK